MSYNLAGLQAAGFEKHGIAADPEWSTPFGMIRADPTGFRPKATSPAVGHGKTLTYAQDFAGSALPTTAAWDIGAFQQ
jgi:hypothetical protein